MPLMGVLFLMMCGRQATEPQGEARFTIRVTYADASASNAFRLSESGSRVGKRITSVLQVQSIDMVRILVADVSEADAPWGLRESDVLGEMKTEFDEGFEALPEWDDWVKLVSNYFPIVSNQSLTIEDGTARGTVTGVVGWNFILVALLEDNATQFWGWEDIMGLEDETEEEPIYVSSWPSDWWGYPIYVPVTESNSVIE